MVPAAKVGVLFSATFVAAGFGLLATNATDGSPPLVLVGVAAGLCLSSAVATLLLADAVIRYAPELGPAAVLMGIAVRMAVAVVGVVLLGEVFAARGESRTAFAGWVAYLYVVTLAAECGLLISGARQIGAGAKP